MALDPLKFITYLRLILSDGITMDVSCEQFN